MKKSIKEEINDAEESLVQRIGILKQQAFDLRLQADNFEAQRQQVITKYNQMLNIIFKLNDELQKLKEDKKDEKGGK